jgi:prophage regulatory protein
MSPEYSRRPAERFLRIEDVIERTSLSQVTIWRLRKQGRFPEPVPISEGRKAWAESHVDRWVAEKLQAA